eukprot:Tamp_14572.p1 GENE.Tamp_14572~~Tamp_14572.p1  ORF type:complete len:460 (-),score=116.12 Tamp_14572:238-1530(-)
MPPTTLDPEDLGLNAAQLSEQNKRVLEAQAKDATSDDLLDMLAEQYRGKPIPDEWDPETHPLFMEDVETQIDEGNPLAQGMAMLKNPDPPEEIAERAKSKGNYYLKRGPRYYKDAVQHYTEAIEARGKDAKKNAIYHSNRAAVELLRKNYGKVVEDCKMAMKLDPSHIKAYFRCAKAQAALHKWALCLEVCEEGLKVEPGNKEILKELAVAKEKLDAKRQEAKKAEAAKAMALLQDSKHQRAITKACQERGVRLGECVYGGAVQGGQGKEAYLDADGAVHWPVLFLYDEFDQSDYFQDTHEDASVEGCVSMLFDPDSPPPEWDPTRRYRPDTVAVYIATNQSKELKQKAKKEQSDEDFLSSLLSGSDRKGAEEEYDLASKTKFVKVPLGASIAEVVKIEDHIVGGFPVLHVVEANSAFERHLLDKGPAVF